MGWAGRFSHMFSQIGMDWDFKLLLLLLQSSDSDINLLLFDRFAFLHCTIKRSPNDINSLLFSWFAFRTGLTSD